MNKEQIAAGIRGLSPKALPRLCARLTQLVAPHLPEKLVAANPPISAAILAIEAIAAENKPACDARALMDSVNRCIDMNQDAFEADSCLPVGEAIAATLAVADNATHEGALEAIMAVYTAVEMKAFMAVGPGDNVIRLIPAALHIEYMKQLRESDPIKGFGAILKMEIEQANKIWTCDIQV